MVQQLKGRFGVLFTVTNQAIKKAITQQQCFESVWDLFAVFNLVKESYNTKIKQNKLFLSLTRRLKASQEKGTPNTHTSIIFIVSHPDHPGKGILMTNILL